MTTAGKRMAHDHHFIDDKFNAFAVAARGGRLSRFQLEDAIRRLRHHFWVEEEFVFPPLAHSSPGPVVAMLREHGVIWDHVDELEAILEMDEPDLDMALAVFAALRQELDTHNETEDSVLYPVADDMLGDDLSKPVLNALATEMPEGWRCQMAQAKV
ncbi:hemerythrin domain-containing protein [Granulicoccus sp. GXG6511]|uniref:hemerythrin domain-containing protein n=1 Tax=Granulicoccus sp. GXG6511 TaxID=3381351 RepID=UPI003D7C6F18